MSMEARSTVRTTLIAGSKYLQARIKVGCCTEEPSITVKSEVRVKQDVESRWTYYFLSSPSSSERQAKAVYVVPLFFIVKVARPAGGAAFRHYNAPTRYRSSVPKPGVATHGANSLSAWASVKGKQPHHPVFRRLGSFGVSNHLFDMLQSWINCKEAPELAAPFHAGPYPPPSLCLLKTSLNWY
jgi:hypothetical protein